MSKARETIIAWDNEGEAATGRWSENSDSCDEWPWDFDYTGGACYAWYHDDTPRGRERDAKVDAVTLDVIRVFMVMVIRHGVNPAEAYRALYQIDEFRDHIPHDMPKPDNLRYHWRVLGQE